MNPALLLPGALGALVALAIPLLIHLARREQQRSTTFAALRWLVERPKPRRRIRFDEVPLLLLRLLLLAMLVLWLARPVLPDAMDTTPWTVVVPGVVDAEARAAMEAAEGEVRWLAPGYPSLLDPAPARPQEVASLLRQLDAQLPPAVTVDVVVPEHLSGLDGGELRLSREVAWRIVAGAPMDQVAASSTPARLYLRHDEATADAARYLRAATLASWPDAAPDDVLDVAPAATPWPVDAQRIAWLVAGPLPASLEHWIDAGGDVLLSSSVELVLPKDEITIAWRDEDGSALVEVAGKGRGRVSRFLRPLRPTDMPQLLSADFPMRLQLLFDTAPAPTRAWAQSQAPLSGAASLQPAPRDLRPWLALLIALLLLAERWLATARGREARA